VDLTLTPSGKVTSARRACWQAAEDPDGGVDLMLVIVCANIANLMLARAVSRQKEFGIRLALGRGGSGWPGRCSSRLSAGRWRSHAGSDPDDVVGADAGLSVCLPRYPVDLAAGPTFPRWIHRGGGDPGNADRGMAPAVMSARFSLSETLNEGGRAGCLGTGSHRLRRLLVGAEMALAVAAMMGRALLAELQERQRIRPGFDRRTFSCRSSTSRMRLLGPRAVAVLSRVARGWRLCRAWPG